MNDGNRPMPLSELPDYMRRARERGQGDDIPVVDMGMIVDDGPRWGRTAAFVLGSAAFLVVGLGVLAASSARDIRIVASGGAGAVSEIVSAEGGRVFSVTQEGDGSYRVRVFAFGGVRPLIDRLRGSDRVESVDIGE